MTLRFPDAETMTQFLSNHDLLKSNYYQEKGITQAVVKMAANRLANDERCDIAMEVTLIIHDLRSGTDKIDLPVTCWIQLSKALTKALEDCANMSQIKTDIPCWDNAVSGDRRAHYRRKYRAYNDDRDYYLKRWNRWIEEWTPESMTTKCPISVHMRQFDSTADPMLLDALFSGCDLVLVRDKRTMRRWTSEIEDDVREIVELFPSSVNCNVAEIRCRDGVHPLAAAVHNEEVPVEIIEFLLQNDADPNMTYSVNCRPQTILDDLKYGQCDLEPERVEQIKELLWIYGGRYTDEQDNLEHEE
jgi:hypothetical protein